MATGDEKVNAALKRFLSQNRLSENVIDYLQTQVIDLGSEMFQSQGLFTYPVSHTYAAGQFDLSVVPAGVIRGTDGEGRILELATARQTGVQFEDNASDLYWVAMKHIEIPSGVYTNPRTTVPEYDKITDEVGELAEPTSVTDNGSNITFNVNSIFESGVDHSGRLVRVWLKNPVDSDEAVAIEENLTVAFSSPDNTVTTSGLLGQGAVSLTVSDYQVACLGVTVRKDATEPTAFATGYLKLGYVVGGGGTSIDNTVDLSGGGGHTLQAAYDGSGNSKLITAADQAVQIKQESLTHREVDIANAAFRINKDVPTTLPPGRFLGEVALDIKSGISSPGVQIIRYPLADYSGGGKLDASETVNLVNGTNQIDFTRVGVDLDLTGLNGIIHTSDYVEISGTANDQDGLYKIDAITDSDTLELENLDGTAVSFTTDNGVTARLYRPIVKLGGRSDCIRLQPATDFYKDASGFATNQIALNARIPENALDTDYVISITKINGGGLCLLQADGKLIVVELESTNDIISLAGDIKTNAGEIESALSVIAGTNVVANTGYVEATIGDVTAGNDVIADQDVTATNGNVTASNGNVIATTGNVQATAGNLLAGGGVLVATDISTTGGDITASAGDVTGDNVIADTGDFKYGSAKQYFLNISAAEFRPAHQSVGNTVWYHVGATWVTSAAPIGNDRLISIVRIPTGAVIDRMIVKWNPTTAPISSAFLFEVDLDLANPGNAPASITMALVTTSTTGYHNSTDSTITNATVNNNTRAYQIEIQMPASGDTFAGAEIRYTIDQVHQN